MPRFCVWAIRFQFYENIAALLSSLCARCNQIRRTHKVMENGDSRSWHCKVNRRNGKEEKTIKREIILNAQSEMLCVWLMWCFVFVHSINIKLNCMISEYFTHSFYPHIFTAEIAVQIGLKTKYDKRKLYFNEVLFSTSLHPKKHMI